MNNLFSCRTRCAYALANMKPFGVQQILSLRNLVGTSGIACGKVRAYAPPSASCLLPNNKTKFMSSTAHAIHDAGDSDSGNIVRPATDQERIDRDHFTFKGFGKHYSLEQWLDREKQLRAHPWSSKSLMSWVLVNKEGQILASCSSYSIDCLRSLPNARKVPGRAIGFATVFVDDAFRGRGYARELLRKVVAQTKALGTVCYIIYSAVGEKIFRDVGFQPRRCCERVFNTSEPSHQNHTSHLITRGEISTLWHRDTNSCEVFSLVPSRGQLDWQLTRQDLATRFSGRDPLHFCGARRGSSFILWGADYHNKALAINCFHGLTVDDAKSLIACALDYGRSLGLEKVVVWEEEEFAEWHELPQRSERRSRDHCIPMMLPVADGLHVDHWSTISQCMHV